MSNQVAALESLVNIAQGKAETLEKAEIQETQEISETQE